LVDELQAQFDEALNQYEPVVNEYNDAYRKHAEGKLHEVMSWTHVPHHVRDHLKYRSHKDGLSLKSNRQTSTQPDGNAQVVYEGEVLERSLDRNGNPITPLEYVSRVHSSTDRDYLQRIGVDLGPSIYQSSTSINNPPPGGNLGQGGNLRSKGGKRKNKKNRKNRTQVTNNDNEAAAKIHNNKDMTEAERIQALMEEFDLSD